MMAAMIVIWPPPTMNGRGMTLPEIVERLMVTLLRSSRRPVLAVSDVYWETKVNIDDLAVVLMARVRGEPDE